MNRELLKELGLEDEAINKVMSEYGKSVNELKDKAEKYDTLEAQINDYKTQLEERDEQLNALSEKAKGNEELTSQIEELKQQNEQVKTEYEEKLTNQQFDFNLDKTLSSEVKNTKAVKSLLDLDTVKFDDGDFIGLKEQVEKLKESDPYLFKEAEEEKKPSYSTGEHKGTNTKIDPFLQGLGLQKRE